MAFFHSRRNFFIFGQKKFETGLAVLRCLLRSEERLIV